MKNKDYMVVSDTTDEELFDTFKDARKRAKELGDAIIYRWIYDGSDMIFDEDFRIMYADGKEICGKRG